VEEIKDALWSLPPGAQKEIATQIVWSLGIDNVDAKKEIATAVLQTLGNADVDAKKEIATVALQTFGFDSIDAKKEVATTALQTLPPDTLGSVIGGITGVSIDQLVEADTGDIQKVAASQIGLLTGFYNAVLAQARRSFNWALIAAGTGLVFFIGAVVFLLTIQSSSIATISVIGGAIVEVIAGVNFYLYNKTTAQLAEFHQRLERTQRFLLANSIAESLENEQKQETRAALVRTIAAL